MFTEIYLKPFSAKICLTRVKCVYAISGTERNCKNHDCFYLSIWDFNIGIYIGINIYKYLNVFIILYYTITIYYNKYIYIYIIFIIFAIKLLFENITQLLKYLNI